jgi:hypothetical protein
LVHLIRLSRSKLEQHLAFTWNWYVGKGLSRSPHEKWNCCYSLIRRHSSKRLFLLAQTKLSSFASHSQLKLHNSEVRKEKFSWACLIGASERHARFPELTDRPRRRNSYETERLRRRSIPPVVINRIECHLNVCGPLVRILDADGSEKKCRGSAGNDRQPLMSIAFTCLRAD